ncbi:MAG TPA: cysteine dioxygenase family protein [Pyrinomonadaceae bacterium]|nr:cysteine dioxygenase family protein [Pyrinomonadaceae bacterium]
MSTNIEQPAAQIAAISEEQPRRFSLQEIAGTLSACEAVPSLEALNEILEKAEVNSDDLSPYRSFKPGTYARHRVFRNEFVEMLVLCWRPGQRTPIHDHNGSHGAVMVCEGIMWETIFELDEEQKLFYRSGREWRERQVTGAEVPDIHQLGNPEVSGCDMVTLHIYAPPLGVLNTYRVGSAEVGHYTPDQFIDGAGI